MTHMSKMLPEDFNNYPIDPCRWAIFIIVLFCILTKYPKRSNWRKQRFILSPDAGDMFHQGREGIAKEGSFLKSAAEKTRKNDNGHMLFSILFSLQTQGMKLCCSCWVQAFTHHLIFPWFTLTNTQDAIS